MRIIKPLGNILYWIVMTVLIVFVIGAAFSRVEGPYGFRIFVVQSGSMEPKIKVGSVVLVAPQKTYKEGDIVTYLISPNANPKKIGSTITHRINTVLESGDFKTKGDSNAAEDNKPISKENILGKVMLAIPYVGYIVSYIRTRMGFTLLVVIPGILIVLNEILNIKTEILSIVRKRREIWIIKDEYSV